MRITSGEFGGRSLKVPKSDMIRPTQDRVREALFSILGDAVKDAAFLDLFAGSGSVGLEALSRGAKSVAFVELNRKHLEILQQNIATLKLSPLTYNVIAADVYRWLATYSGEGFDLVYADPPYALGEERGYAAVLKMLSERGVVKPGALFIAEMTAAQAADNLDDWELLRDRTYGKTRICIWRRTK